MRGMNFAIALIMVTILIAVILWVYMIGSVIVIESLSPELETVASELNNSDVDTVIEQTKTSWIVGPIILIVGLILLLFILSQKTEYSQERSYGY